LHSLKDTKPFLDRTFVRAGAETLKAYAICARALSVLTSVLGQLSERCINLAAKIEALPSPVGERGELSKLVTVRDKSAPQHDRKTYSLRLLIRKLIKKAL
jgi:hypothetical protein